MSRIVKIALIILVAGALLPLTAEDEKQPADPWDSSPLAKARFDTLWTGPSIDKRNLKGNVVLVYHWSMQVPQAIKYLPALAGLHARHSDDGLFVIGAVVHGNPDPSDAVRLVRSKGVKFTIVSHAVVWEVRPKFPDLPYVVVFDHTGKIAYKGEPNAEMLKTLNKALRQRPDPILGEREFEHLTAAAGRVKAGDLAGAWRICDFRKDDENSEIAAEAKYILDKIRAHVDEVMKYSREIRLENPLRSVNLLRRLKAETKGTPCAEKVKKELAELDKDEDFQVQLKSYRAYKKVKDAAILVPRYPKKKNDRLRWNRKYAGAIRKLRAAVVQMKQNWPDAYWTSQADAVVAELIPSE